jgi:hypothetical protein
MRSSLALTVQSPAEKDTATVTANSGGVETEERGIRPNLGKPAQWLTARRPAPLRVQQGVGVVVPRR